MRMSDDAQQSHPLPPKLLCEDRTFNHEAVSFATPLMPPVFGGE